MILFRAAPPSSYARMHFVGVASLGFSRVLLIVNELFGSTKTPKISRVDLCVDIPGLPVEFFRDGMTVERVRTVGFIRSPGATTLRYGSPSSRSYYIVCHKNWKAPKNEAGPPLTRIERRFRGKACPVITVERMELLRSYDPFEKVSLQAGSVSRRDAETGRALVNALALDRIRELGWSRQEAIQRGGLTVKRLLDRTAGGETDLPDLGRLYRTSVARWLDS